MADENDKTIETEAPPPPPVVNPTPPPEHTAPPVSDNHVTKSEFGELSNAVSALTELVGKLVPGTVERDSTDAKVPWTHRGSRRKP